MEKDATFEVDIYKNSAHKRHKPSLKLINTIRNLHSKTLSQFGETEPEKRPQIQRNNKTMEIAICPNELSEWYQKMESRKYDQRLACIFKKARLLQTVGLDLMQKWSNGLSCINKQLVFSFKLKYPSFSDVPLKP